MFATRHHRFRVSDYHRMAGAGILTGDDRVELISGEILTMPPIGSQHAAHVERLRDRLEEALADHSAMVRSRQPVRLKGRSEPEPDLAVVKPREDYYAEEHPRPTDILLLIEVADSSIDYDRTIKIPLYAKAGIPEVWLVNLVEHQIEAFRYPLNGTYSKPAVYTRADVAECEPIPGFTVTPKDLGI